MLDGYDADADLRPWLVHFFDPDFEWHDAPSFPGAAVYQGREAFDGHVEDFLDAWADSRIEIEDISSVGDRVLAHIRDVGTGHQSGVELEDNVVIAIHHLSGGRVLRVRQFVDERGPRSRGAVGVGMSQENVEIVRRAFESFARGTGCGLLDPELDPGCPWKLDSGT